MKGGNEIRKEFDNLFLWVVNGMQSASTKQMGEPVDVCILRGGGNLS